MDFSGLIKAVTLFSFSLKEDFQHYFQQQTGQAKMEEADFQQLSDGDSKNEPQEQKQDPDQFYVEGLQEQQPIQTIKTYQFNSGMFAPTKQTQKIIASAPDINIQVQQYFGYNSKQMENCIVLSQKYYCISVGTILLICPFQKQNKTKGYKHFSAHYYQVSALYYLKQRKMLISGSKGLKPEIIIWQFEQSNDYEKINLIVRKKFKLPNKSQGTRAIQALGPNLILCLDSLSIHRGNSLYFFKLEDEKNGEQNTKIKQKQPIKFQAKLFDMHVNQQKKRIYFASDKGVLQLQSPESQQIKNINTKINEVLTIQGFKNYLMVGTIKGNLAILNQTGQIVHQLNIFKGWVFKLLPIPEKDLILACGQGDNLLKIYQIQQKGKSVIASMTQNIDVKSYCTSLNYFNPSNVLIALRDGSILLFNCLSNTKKFQRISSFSYIQKDQSYAFCYNQLSERIISMPNRDVILQLSLEDQGATSKRIQCVQKKLNRKPKCVYFYKEKVGQVFRTSKTKYEIIMSSLINIQGDPIYSFKYELESLGAQTTKLSQKQGTKPKEKVDEIILIRFTEQLLLLGTKAGRIIVNVIKNNIIIISTEAHKDKVQQIIAQDGAYKKGQPFYLKSVSKSELFYWELKQEDRKIIRINKAAPLKDLKWLGLCKYSWESKNIWEQMTHFQDITSVCLVGKFICASMQDGKIRIYRHPATKANYQQWQLFPGRFRLLACQRMNNTLICQRNCQILILKIRPNT